MVTGLLIALSLAALASAQSSLYSTGGCRISSDDADSLVNVTCSCSQIIAQTDQSVPIDELTITGCSETPDPTVSPPLIIIGLTEPRRRLLGNRNFILLDVRKLRLSRGRFQLQPVRHRAPSHPLQTLEIMQAELPSGLDDDALAGLPNLREITLSEVDITAMRPGAISDLPQLRSLKIVDCACTFMNEHSMNRVPRLKQFHVIRSELHFIRTNAFRIDPTDSDAGIPIQDDETCPMAVTEALTEPRKDAATVFISGNNIHAMSQQAFVFNGFQHVVFSDNSVGDMGERSLGVTLHAPDDCPYNSSDTLVIQFFDNQLDDMRDQALDVVNLDAYRPAALFLGGNVLLQAALSPLQLRLNGSFQPSESFAQNNPSQYDCECCGCASTDRLLKLTMVTTDGTPDPVTAALTDSILTASCVRGDMTFAEFAERCQPGVIAKLGGSDPTLPMVPTPKVSAAAGLAPTGCVLMLVSLMVMM